MFQIMWSCISQLWGLLCESIMSSSTNPSSSPSDPMPSATTSQPPSSSQASTADSQTLYDVYLSFHGKDTRRNFTSHLYQRLDAHGIRTFRDDPELCSGEVISDALLDAIRNSKTYIVVLSENYASSSWCLDELVEIFNCHKAAKRSIIPVFYKVDPSAVRHQIGSFKQAFEKHQFRFEMEKINNWRLTLKQVADFSGFHISHENRFEAHLINEIVDEVLLKINPKTLDVTKYPVGLDSRVKSITTLLCSETKGVIKFGIYGTGGVGKTTLAKALYNQLVRGGTFKGSCFLANVRENSGTTKGLVSLQAQLINDVLSSTTKVDVHNVDQGIKLIQDRICSTKVLVVIDDLDDLKHFRSLAGPFASGSVVIITTRDKEILDKIEVETRYRYRVNTLDDADALALFKRHAFGSAETNNTLMELSKDILCLAGGLPLALEGFGSYLYKRSEGEWKSYIEKLSQNPNMRRLEILRWCSPDSVPAGWDVFLSFHGPDTRHKFTSHLYAALDRYGVRTFMDDLELLREEVISDALNKAIRESKIYIVVLSKNYASSCWCLDELVQIFNCCNTKQRLLIPVYYYIDPPAPGHQIGSFQEAFEIYQTQFDMDRSDKWRSALANLAHLPEYRLLENMYQTGIINKVVDMVLLQINPMNLDVAKYPVGLESRVEDITALLSSDIEGVIRIGIHGMGGVGKTTLAKAVYNQNYHRFHGSCFLENVREVSRTGRGLICLQQQLINDVLKYRNIKIDNVYQGIELIRARICPLKVLLVIDDLDDPKPLNFLVGLFALGSIIIITTRNEDLLDSIKVEARYKVNELNGIESRQLFTQHAFGDNIISETLEKLSKEILEHAGGLPMALAVYGSKLTYQSEEGWRLFIDSLKRISITEIEEKLLISFEALELVDPVLQDIFLDISCFFIGWKKEEVVKTMETYYLFVSYHIDILKKRCLLTINDRDELEMHGLLQEMGRKIVRNNSPHEPGKHSRLWVSKDIYDVLKHHQGTEAIQGIVCSNFDYQDAFEGVSFKIMSKLRFLYLKKVNLIGSFEQTFEDLRWLRWDCCPLKCLPSEFYPQELVILALPHSKIRTMWELNVVSPVFEKLTILNMSHSLDLTTTPDFNKLPCLETLDLEGCKSLEEVHVSIGSLLRLISLNLRGCVNLRSLPHSICILRALKSLNVGGCSRLEALPTGLGNIKSLIELNTEGLTISKLLDSVGSVSKLVGDNLSDDKYHETPSSAAPTVWDVFLSYCGSNTRNDFTSHLYKKLVSFGVLTFMDDPTLPRGEEISDALLKAIQDSKIYVVVLSENYASSPWSLDELVQILNCSKSMQRLVIPVFYGIDPSDVYHQTGSFRKSFDEHELCFGGEMEKVSKWRVKLTDIARYPGHHIANNRDEVNSINEIVDVILLQLKPKTLHVAKHPVGLDSRVRYITALLSSYTEGVTKIGLYGMGGVGKTTLAKALYNQLLQEGSFMGSCFLTNVREASLTAKGILSLQQKLIGDVLRIKNVEVSTASKVKMFIRERFCSSKVLVVIDDIDDIKQYESLVGPFAFGSVVIITTRDEEILDKIAVNPRYQYRVNELDDAESVELFYQYAFGNGQPNNTFKELSVQVLQHASGLPLALEIFGSYLSKKSEDGWNTYIDKLKQSPNMTIQKRLMISFDALETDDPILKKLFLDIACFFIGRRKKEVVNIMETYYSDIDHYIDLLKKRCLLTINERDELMMHHMLRDLGREIARNNSPTEPEKHSRLWVTKDVLDVLRNHKGTKAVEGIIPRSLYYQDELEGESFSTETFQMMKKLRFLYLKKVKIIGSFKQIFQDLRWLCWDCCPLKYLPSEFYPQRLVTLELPRSNMRTMWEPNMIPNVFETLKTLNMSYSLDLITSPDFTNLPCLETLNLKYCESLEEVHLSIGSLVRLVSIDLHGCVKLRSLPETICYLRALKVLGIGQCSRLIALPGKLGNMKSLKMIYAEGLTILSLPDSIGNLCKLVGLRLSYSKNLGTLPSTIYNLSSLENLDLAFCRNLLSISELPPNLKWMSAEGCISIEGLPNLSNLKQLEDLDLTDCTGLREIQGLEELTSIRKLCLGGCNSYLLEYTLTERFFQIYSELGHAIIICTELPNWISQSGDLGSTVSLDLLPNVSHKFLGMILCFKPVEESFITYVVKNTTSGFMWTSKSYSKYHVSLMVIVPRSIFSLVDGDHTIEIKADAVISGIHLMYKNE